MEREGKLIQLRKMFNYDLNECGWRNLVSEPNSINSLWAATQGAFNYFDFYENIYYRNGYDKYE